MKKTAVGFCLLFFVCGFFFNCKTATKKEIAQLLSPQEAIADFQIETGFDVQPVATEPLVEDPVALQFDENGAMWVVEMRGYMQDKDGRGENLPLGRIKVLQDKNDDGTYESAQVFLDSLVMPRAVALVKGGALLIEPPKLFFVENNNGKAGARTLLDSTFAESGNAEHQPNGLMRALDNWIYSAKSGKRIRYSNNKWVIEKTQFRGQWGITQDDYGRLFYNDNSTTLPGDAFLPNAFAENEAYRRLAQNSYSTQLVSNRVFPARGTPGVNRGYETGMLDSTKKLVNVTAACGPVVYRGDNFPEAYRGDAFVMEPAAYLIKRIRLTDSAGFVRGAFAYHNKEFLTATDERFRPVNAYNAPDGSLFFIDMHRGIIQHTTYLTPYLRQYIDSLKLERPISMGRIYRIKWKEHGLSKKLRLSARPSAQLVPLLQHKNGWYRDMAQRLLVERGDTTVAASLKTLALGADAIATMHALYTLEGLQQLSPLFLEQVAQRTASRFVYTACLKLLEGSPTDRHAFDVLKRLATKQDRFVALQFTNSLPHFEKAFPAEVKQLLLEQMHNHRGDTLFLDAFMSSAAGRERERLGWLSRTDAPDTTLRQLLQNTIAKQKQMQAAALTWLGKKEAELYRSGEANFKKFCATCHGAAGDGLPNVAPPLAGSQWVLTEVSVPIRILLDGMYGPVEVAGKRYAPPQYNGTMPGLRHNIETNNGVIASVLTYVRNAWGNKAAAVTVEQVADIRKKTEGRQQPYTAVELQDDLTNRKETVLRENK